MAAGLEDSSATLTARASLDIAEALNSGRIKTRSQLEAEKRKIAVKYNLGRYLSNSDLLESFRHAGVSIPGQILQVHPRRGASGIIVITAFSAPFLCPHGTCTFCPGGPPTGTPQSYLPDGPGMKNALGADFDPLVQVRNSLRKYKENGHDISKIEMIVEGGTFIATPKEYQETFVKGVYDGLNAAVCPTLEEAQVANESAESRCVGLSIESKPDWCEPVHLDSMLRYGFTRVEIGVQSLRDSVLKLSNRGHSVADSVRAFQTTRDAGLKVVAHMMPGLPGADAEADLEDLRTLFEDESFRPDMLKVYPTLVVEGTALAKQYQLGNYKPFDLETSVELLARMKQFVPRWLRIMRIQREIPIRHIIGGVRNGNLRELVRARAAEKGFSCKCIRCREVALSEPSQHSDEPLLLFSEEYPASGGTEVFASFEYEKSRLLAGFIRMRYPSERAHRREIRGSCVIRELKVYGRVVRVGERDSSAWQHRGLGGTLLAEMERRAREEFGVRTILVTSAVGTRNYYRKFGYERLGPYMARNLN